MPPQAGWTPCRVKLVVHPLGSVSTPYPDRSRGDRHRMVGAMRCAAGLEPRYHHFGESLAHMPPALIILLPAMISHDV